MGVDVNRWFVVGLLLFACEGGPEPISPRITYGIRTFSFEWDSREDVTDFVLEETLADGTTQVIAELPGSARSFDHTVPLWTRVGASYVLHTCSDGRCSAAEPLFADANQAIGYLKASTPEPNEGFGLGLDMCRDGSTFVTTAARPDGVPGGPAVGEAHVLGRDADGRWVEQALVQTEPESTNTLWVAAISGDCQTIALGSSQEGATNRGAVHLLERNQDGWTEVARLEGSNAESNHFFGASVALDAAGMRLVVGATGGSGAAYVFERTEGGWEELAYLEAPHPGDGDQFGNWTAISGDGQTVAVSAPSERSNALGLDGDATNDEAETVHFGAVYVYKAEEATGSVEHQAYLKALQPDAGLPGNIALNDDGSTLVAGGRNEQPAVVIEQDANGWSVAEELTPWSSVWRPTGVAHYGLDLSADGLTIAVGTLSESSDGQGLAAEARGGTALGSGAVFLFTREASGWEETAFVKAPNSEEWDGFGFSVSLGAEGEILAVGAPGEAGSSAGVGGDMADNTLGGSGAVFLF